jgi:flagellar protein FlaJ
MVLQWVPLAAALAVLGVLVAERFSRRVEVFLTSVAYRRQGHELTVDEPLRQRLRAAGIGTPYRIYQSKTSLYAVSGAFVGTVLGGYVASAVLATLGIGSIVDGLPAAPFTWVPDPLREPPVQETALLVGGAVVFGVVTGVGIRVFRWTIPSVVGDTRRRQIDAGMPRTVAFVYALSRGGMSFPDAMRSLSRNQGVFGAGAAEFAVGVRDIDVFGSDVVEAVKGISDRTPSEGLRRFTENLASVLQSGGSLAEFLENEYERYRDEAKEQQEEILELLATAAEVYVTVVVAGMLFLITILLVLGLTTGDTLFLVRLSTYVVLPATNVLFVAYLTDVTQPLRATRDSNEEILAAGAPGDTLGLDGVGRVGDRSGLAADGGYGETAGTGLDRANAGRLRAFKRLRGVIRTLGSPVEALLQRPEVLLLVTVPLASLYVGAGLPGALEGGFSSRAFDDLLVQAVLFVFGTYAVVYELSRQRLERLEGGLPDLLERLASLNEAGVSIVSSLDRVRRTDVGELNEEVERLWRDLQWGATVEQALDRFEKRVETAAVTRVVTLFNSAMRASNEIGPVLRIAADQARSDQQLRTRRRQTMFTYLVVIYVSFVVFVLVVAAIDTVLIPSLPAEPVATDAPGSGLLSISREGTEDYRLAFFHAALIQSTLSGLVGGQMGEGSIKDGVKHATIMLGITYTVFLLFDAFALGI